jgi:beta-lactamase class D
MNPSRRELLRGAAAGLLWPAAASAAYEKPSTGPSSNALDIGRRFRERGVVGTFVLRAVKDDTMLVHNPSRAGEAFAPASTFKIPNSLISLETGVIEDENEVLKWDGVKRDVEAWNKDHNMRTAIAASAVWFYQEMARRIGEKRMKEWVDRLAYGNRNISGGIDQFWLTGGLRITAYQQIDFLARLQANTLPVTPRALRIVKEILILEETDSYVLRGKTGLGGVTASGAGKPDVGWFVGWIERGDLAWLFALNVAWKDGLDIGIRKAIALDILKDVGLLEKP